MHRTYVSSGELGIPHRARRIIQEFQSITADAKQIAERMGFRDHLVMADFMRRNDFSWSTEKQ